MKMRKGGMGTNIIVFLILFSFGVSVYNCTSPTNAYPGALCPSTISYNNLVSGVSTNLFSNFNNLGTAVGIVVAIIGTFAFPNPYAIFFGISLAVVSLATPGGLIYTILGSQSGIPEPVIELFRSVFIPVFIIAIVAWYAGRDTW